eukprot:s1083_g1.t1
MAKPFNVPQDCFNELSSRLDDLSRQLEGPTPKASSAAPAAPAAPVSMASTAEKVATLRRRVESRESRSVGSVSNSETESEATQDVLTMEFASQLQKEEDPAELEQPNRSSKVPVFFAPKSEEACAETNETNETNAMNHAQQQTLEFFLEETMRKLELKLDALLKEPRREKRMRIFQAQEEVAPIARRSRSLPNIHDDRNAPNYPNHKLLGCTPESQPRHLARDSGPPLAADQGCILKHFDRCICLAGTREEALHSYSPQDSAGGTFPATFEDAVFGAVSWAVDRKVQTLLQKRRMQSGACRAIEAGLVLWVTGGLRTAMDLHQALQNLESLRAAFVAPTLSPTAPLQGLAKRLEEVISVESRCILTRGRVAKEQALIIVAELLSSLLHLYRLNGREEAVKVGQNLLPNMLECILVGITKCWQSDWKGHLRPQLQPMHDLVLRRPLLEKAALSLLRLVWDRAPSLLDGSTGAVAVAVSPQCAYALASLSQEIHDELMATDLAEAQAADLELMSQLRRVVLEFLGQAGLRRRHRQKAPPVPRSDAAFDAAAPLQMVVATPSPKKRDRDPDDDDPASDAEGPGPSRKVKRPGDQLSEPPSKKLEEADKTQGVDQLLELLLKDYGASSLATSLADRAEKCLDTIAWAASKGIAPEAVLQARQTLEDFLQYLRRLLQHPEGAAAIAWRMPRFVQRLCDSGRWEDAWRFSLAKVLDLVVHPLMAPHSATALWAQVVGDRSQCPKRMAAVGSLAKELEIVLTFADQEYTKLQDSMHHLVKSANDCLNRQSDSDDAKEEEAKPSGSRNARCESESEEIGSQDTLSDINAESEADFSDFEDTRPEMNNLGFLKADGQHLGSVESL